MYPVSNMLNLIFLYLSARNIYLLSIVINKSILISCILISCILCIFSYIMFRILFILVPDSCTVYPVSCNMYLVLCILYYETCSSILYPVLLNLPISSLYPGYISPDYSSIYSRCKLTYDGRDQGIVDIK